jgi:hypothetical protein
MRGKPGYHSPFSTVFLEPGFREKSWNRWINVLKYREKFQIYLEISQEFLSSSWQCCSNLRVLPTDFSFSYIGAPRDMKKIIVGLLRLLVEWSARIPVRARSFPFSGPTLGPTQPPFQWVSGFFLRVKLTGSWGLPVTSI